MSKQRLLLQKIENLIKDLFENIQAGNFPKWSFEIQIMTDSQAKNCAFNPFDLTKVWPHGDFSYD